MVKNLCKWDAYGMKVNDQDYKQYKLVTWEKPMVEEIYIMVIYLTIIWNHVTDGNGHNRRPSIFPYPYTLLTC